MDLKIELIDSLADFIIVWVVIILCKVQNLIRSF